MTYATKINMVGRFGESEVIALTDRDGLGVVDDAVLAGAMGEADAEIDPYLAAHYQLPLTQVPKILAGFACDIARYRLSGSGVTVTEEVRARYKDAVRFLERVSEGKIPLGLDAADAAPAEQTPVRFTAPARVFDRTALSGY